MAVGAGIGLCGIGRAGIAQIPTFVTIVLFTTPGSQTWTVPAGVTSIIVEGIGGGQAGFDSTATVGGSGGIAGSYCKSVISVSAGQTIYLYVGSAGASNGATGSDSWANAVANAAPGLSANGILAIGGNSGSTNVGSTINAGGAAGSQGGVANPSYGGGGGGAGGHLGAGSSGGNASGGAGGSGGAANNSTVAGGAGTYGSGSPGNSGVSWTQTSDGTRAGSGSGGGGG